MATRNDNWLAKTWQNDKVSAQVWSEFVSFIHKTFAIAGQFSKTCYASGMERPNWVYWPDQDKWRAYPEGFPDREIQAASFDELQLKVNQLSRDLVKSPREIPRVERPNQGNPNLVAPRYVLSQEQGKWRGHLQGYPEHAAQGESFDEVQFKLVQLCRALIAGKQIPLRKAA